MCTVLLVKRENGLILVRKEFSHTCFSQRINYKHYFQPEKILQRRIRLEKISVTGDYVTKDHTQYGGKKGEKIRPCLGLIDKYLNEFILSHTYCHICAITR